MKYTFTQPTTRIMTAQHVMAAARLDADLENIPYLESLIDAATIHAETAMACSLITRTITATFYAGEALRLPRGPIVSITSVTADDILQAAADYSIENYGLYDVLQFKTSTFSTLDSPKTVVVVYTAGYGAAAANIPANLVQVIRAHVCAMYENREMPVENFEAFYKMYGRDPGVG